MTQDLIERLLKAIARVTGGHRSNVSLSLDGQVATIDGELFRTDCVLEALRRVPDGVHVPPADMLTDIIGQCRTQQ